MKWYNTNKTVMVETAAIEFYKYKEKAHHYFKGQEKPLDQLIISMYGNTQIFVGVEANELYQFLLKEYK